jgi:hypothetical protein
MRTPRRPLCLCVFALGDSALQIRAIPSRLFARRSDSLELTGLRPLHRVPDDDLISSATLSVVVT